MYYVWSHSTKAPPPALAGIVPHTTEPANANTTSMRSLRIATSSSAFISTDRPSGPAVPSSGGTSRRVGRYGGQEEHGPSTLRKEFAMRTRMFAGAAALAMLFACTGGGSIGTAPSVSIPRDVLVLDTTEGSVVVDTNAGLLLADDAGAVVDPAGARLYATKTGGGFTTVEPRDALDGLLLSN